MTERCRCKLSACGHYRPRQVEVEISKGVFKVAAFKKMFARGQAVLERLGREK